MHLPRRQSSHAVRLQSIPAGARSAATHMIYKNRDPCARKMWNSSISTETSLPPAVAKASAIGPAGARPVTAVLRRSVRGKGRPATGCEGSRHRRSLPASAVAPRQATTSPAGGQQDRPPILSEIEIHTSVARLTLRTSACQRWCEEGCVHGRRSPANCAKPRGRSAAGTGGSTSGHAAQSRLPHTKLHSTPSSQLQFSHFIHFSKSYRSRTSIRWDELRFDHSTIIFIF